MIGSVCGVTSWGKQWYRRIPTVVVIGIKNNNYICVSDIDRLSDIITVDSNKFKVCFELLQEPKRIKVKGIKILEHVFVYKEFNGYHHLTEQEHAVPARLENII